MALLVVEWIFRLFWFKRWESPIEFVKQLLAVLHRLRDHRNTVLVIEHNLDVIKTADWIVDLGPEGGSGGGQIIATGTPENVAKVSTSHTGHFLNKLLT